MIAVLNARAVADILGCHPDTVYAYARAGKLPGPIDDTLYTRMWRWSPKVIEAYVAGEWKPGEAA